MINPQKQKNLTKPLPDKIFIEAINMEEKNFPFHCVPSNKQHTPCQKPHANFLKFPTRVQDQFLHWSAISFNNEAKNGQQAFFQIIFDWHELVKFKDFFFFNLETMQSWVQINKIINSQKIVNTDPLKVLDSFSEIQPKKVIREFADWFTRWVHNTTVSKYIVSTRIQRSRKCKLNFLCALRCLF